MLGMYMKINHDDVIKYRSVGVGIKDLNGVTCWIVYL